LTRDEEEGKSEGREELWLGKAPWRPVEEVRLD
jgi:hypothetical protein